MLETPDKCSQHHIEAVRIENTSKTHQENTNLFVRASQFY